MLALATSAQAATNVFLATPVFLIPILHDRRGMSLARAGFLATVPSIGMVLTLFAWGALADRVGERRVLIGGLALTLGATLGAILSRGYFGLGLCFLIGGMAAASANAASGRVVVGWFPRERRGLAMGIRQIAPSLGMAIAAATVPTVADHLGLNGALFVPLVFGAVVMIPCVLGLLDPARPAVAEVSTVPDSRNPYRASSYLWRIHMVSILLVIPQFTLSIFGLVWLVSDQHWNLLSAGWLVGFAQLTGAAGRIAIGVASDHVAVRARLLRWVAGAACGAMVLLAVLAARHWAGVAVGFVIATTISVADNGVAFTSVAEVAGPQWAGRALGAQNTGQFVASSLVGPLMGGLIGAVGYSSAFVAAAVCAALALPFVPSRDVDSS
jgi:MFS family permease